METTLSLLLCSFVFAFVCSTRLFSWRLYEDQAVTDHDSVTSASSEMTCVRECMKHSQCDSCAYNRESGTCYLQVRTEVDTAPASNKTVVFKGISLCKVPSGLVADNATHVVWIKKGWELEGDVVCDDDDYINIGERPTFHCSSAGHWTEKPWDCRRRIWRNPTNSAHLHVPKTPEPGWTVCVNGTPTAATRFNINFEQDSDNLVFHADFRQHYDTYTNAFSLAQLVDRNWSGQVVYNDTDPFPIAVNQPFVIVIKAPTLYEIRLFVDGTFIGNYTTHTSLDNVINVHFEQDVKVHSVDLWCDH
ncbi:hypothetical protein V1264_004761 [Littorina saxatilis]|uniref:Galectin n=1 Tax=Littorina saxatilis TaxID=31220 RepID=A0AAN9B5F9_9CAEN